MLTKKCFTLLLFAIVLNIVCIVKVSAQAAKTDSLAMYRVQIDSLDKQLIELLGRRMLVVEAVGRYKVLHNMPALQQSRFDAILQKNIAMGRAYNLSATLITEVMNAIHKESLTKENALAADKSSGQ